MFTFVMVIHFYWSKPIKSFLFLQREDRKHGEDANELSQTQVIKGNAPDSNFQIVHSQKQSQDKGDGSRTLSSSVSYQMSSVTGSRSSSKVASFSCLHS